MDGWKREGGKGLASMANGVGGVGGVWLDDQTLLDVWLDIGHVAFLFSLWTAGRGRVERGLHPWQMEWCVCARLRVCVCARARVCVCVCVCKWTSGYSWMTTLCRMCGSTSATLPWSVPLILLPFMVGWKKEWYGVCVRVCVCVCVEGGGMLDDQTLPDVWFNIGRVDLVSSFLSSLQTAGRGNDA